MATCRPESLVKQEVLLSVSGLGDEWREQDDESGAGSQETKTGSIYQPPVLVLLLRGYSLLWFDGAIVDTHIIDQAGEVGSWGYVLVAANVQVSCAGHRNIYSFFCDQHTVSTKCS